MVRYKGSNFRNSIVWPKSVAVTISGLVVVSVCYHLLLQSDQDLFHSSFSVPLSEKWEFGRLNNSIRLVD